MNDDLTVAPLRIANEAFLVTSSIDRCPKTMMLRELVMNALEAASGTGSKLVRIMSDRLEGVRKLVIWNTGRGMTADQLLAITDLSSSLGKHVGLDGNFGMGAKVASLASNRLGLRYRSCHLGRVSQVVLGKRGGIYGRILQPSSISSDLSEVIDVTEVCLSEGRYDNSEDWTEVVLMGDRAGQDTALSPYDDNPHVPTNWILNELGRRFLYLPQDVVMRVEATCGLAQDTVFQSPFDERWFDRYERIPVNGIILHYAYRGPDSSRPEPISPSLGTGAVVYAGELYAIIDGARWNLEAPVYGFPFASRWCSVLIELPAAYPVMPEIYRQFLRFRDGDQRQIVFGDFGSLVRDNIPAWMRRIIAAMMPDLGTDLAHIKTDLSQLLEELGLDDGSHELTRTEQDFTEHADSATADNSLTLPEAPTPLPARRPVAPEVILLEDDQSIIDKGLVGRAGRYYPEARQIFVNIRYSPFLRLSAQLEAEFAQAADPNTISSVAKRTAELTLTRRLGRTVIFGMSKRNQNWSDEELRRGQSPESLSLALDDIEAVWHLAQAQMALHLGQEIPRVSISRSDTETSRRQRLAGELAEREAELQQAIRSNWPVVEFIRRLANIETRRHNLDVAEKWLQRAIDADPGSPWPHFDLAHLLQNRQDLKGAVRACDRAIDLTEGQTAIFLVRRGELEVACGNTARAREFFERAVATEPNDYWARLALSNHFLTEGDLEAAEAGAIAALGVGPAKPVAAYIRMSQIARRKGERSEARQWIERALGLEPNDFWANLVFSELLSEEGDLEAADLAAASAIASNPPNPALAYRRRGDLAFERADITAAKTFYEQAVTVAPSDPGPLLSLARLYTETRDFPAARRATEAALNMKPTNPGPVLLRLAEIEARDGNTTKALELRRRAVTEAQTDVWAPLELARQLKAEGEFDEAETTLEKSIQQHVSTRAAAFTMLAELEVKRGMPQRAIERLQSAISADRGHVWAWVLLSQVSMQTNDLETAEAAAQNALGCKPANTGFILRRLGEIALRRGNLDQAVSFGERAVSADPKDPWSRLFLSDVCLTKGDFERASDVAKDAIG